MPKYDAKKLKEMLDNKEIDVAKYAKDLSGVFVAKPTPNMSPKATASQFWNNIVDWITFYWSDANEIDDFEDATTRLDKPKEVNEYFRHEFHYEYDREDEDHWRTPEDFYNERDDSGKIRDDCEGTAWFAQYCIAQANVVDSREIINNYTAIDKIDKMILCMYNDDEGHATSIYTQDGEFTTVDNWGRINHGIKAKKENLPEVGRNFIDDADWFTLSVSNDEGTDTIYVEGGEAEAYRTGKGFILKARDIEKINNFDLVKVVGDELKFRKNKLRKEGYDADKVVKYFKAEFKNKGIGARNLAKQLKLPVKKLARLYVA